MQTVSAIISPPRALGPNSAGMTGSWYSQCTSGRAMSSTATSTTTISGRKISADRASVFTLPSPAISTSNAITPTKIHALLSGKIVPMNRSAPLRRINPP